MDDGLEEVVEYDPVTFMDGLRAKDALRPCPCCGAQDWRTSEDGLVRIPGTVSEVGVAFRVKMAMECAPVTCGNCAFVRFHLLGNYLG